MVARLNATAPSLIMIYIAVFMPCSTKVPADLQSVGRIRRSHLRCRILRREQLGEHEEAYTGDNKAGDDRLMYLVASDHTVPHVVDHDNDDRTADQGSRCTDRGCAAPVHADYVREESSCRAEREAEHKDREKAARVEQRDEPPPISVAVRVPAIRIGPRRLPATIKSELLLIRFDDAQPI